MFLHIGNNFSVDMRDVIGIFDLENTTVQKCTKLLLDRAAKEKCCVYINYEMPKSFIVTSRKGIEKIYISPLSAATLRKRLGAGGGYETGAGFD